MLYEWRRAFSRKKVIVLVIVSLFFEIAVYLAVAFVPSERVKVLLTPFYPYMWALGVLLPQSLLLHFLAISISSGSMSEEYEQGTIDFFLTKAITRSRFITEKWLGSFTLLVFIYGIMVILSLLMSFSLFGSQQDVYLLPEIVASVLFSSLVFFNIAFMIGEVLRRSSLSFIISSSILIGSILVSDVLEFINLITHSPQYITIAEYLPSWGATQLPFILVSNSPFSILIQAIDLLPTISNNINIAIISVLVYSIIPIVMSFSSFLNRDIPKKIS
ncbi:ABC transporter permease [Sulfurisphaera javensis]|uniref:ABC transporter permease n=2 Tax=Sulfurisphaera javensis TaxID=2049879 RepID=A0AAT9GPJ2_9CREN